MDYCLIRKDFPNVGDNDYASTLRTKTLSVSRSASDESDPDLRMGSESQVAQKDKDDWVWIWEYDRGSSLLNYSLLSHIAIELRNRIPRATHIKRGISYPGSFTGKDLVITIKQLIHQELPLGLFYPTFVRDAALQVARSLQSHSFFYEPDSSARGVQDSVGHVYMLQYGSDNGRISGFDSAPSLSTITSTPESNIETLPTGVMTMLTGCYAPTCVGRGPCYALHCPKKSYPLFDVDEGGTEPVPLFSEKSWSQTIPDEILASLPENEINRQTTIQKILQQEAQYIHDLDIVETVFIRPLRYANPPIISPPVALEQFITDVFCNILELRQCSKSLRESILVRQREGQYTIQRVGDILLNIATEYRQVYSVYLGLRTFAERKTRDELEENVQFKTFLEQASEQHFPLERDSTDKPQLALDLLLNRPSEHLQKFLSLLEAVLNETTANHPDMNDLKGAIGMIKAFAQLRTRRLHA
ncbi:Dbl homology domain-containing protein [Dendrothele bispora CBS 962.96]|uniref:Dbl homology domain-containing protein n=1 Tax=Dendrothele bispora (strain CBS 962.96) TaxID=1314807 RepID=A0A4S8LJF7_DENBC|nr:Dbl homology domain-containing protein [Dendrothele bispora CBS 962.96]